MPSISDMMLSAGCAPHVEAYHGEPVYILSGADAGKTFTAVKEIESDMIFDSELGIDPRGKRILRFRETSVPNLNSQDAVRTSDGKAWKAIRRPGNQYLTVDFELTEIVSGKDA